MQYRRSNTSRLAVRMMFCGRLDEMKASGEDVVDSDRIALCAKGRERTMWMQTRKRKSKLDFEIIASQRNAAVKHANLGKD